MRFKLWSEEEDEGFFNYLLESMFKDFKKTISIRRLQKLLQSV